MPIKIVNKKIVSVDNVDTSDIMEALQIQQRFLEQEMYEANTLHIALSKAEDQVRRTSKLIDTLHNLIRADINI